MQQGEVIKLKTRTTHFSPRYKCAAGRNHACCSHRDLASRLQSLMFTWIFIDTADYFFSSNVLQYFFIDSIRTGYHCD